MYICDNLRDMIYHYIAANIMFYRTKKNVIDHIINLIILPPRTQTIYFLSKNLSQEQPNRNIYINILIVDLLALNVSVTVS